MQKWKSVYQYKNWYEVSDKGKVRSVDRYVHFSDGRIRFYKGKLLGQYFDDFGYPKVTLKRNSKDYRVHVHFLVAEAFHGKRPKKRQVRHRDGNPKHPFAKNLHYGTSKENHADTLRHGRRPYGEKAGPAKFSSVIITKIKKYRGKLSGRTIAKKFDMSPAHVCNIQLGRRRIYHESKKRG